MSVIQDVVTSPDVEWKRQGASQTGMQITDPGTPEAHPFSLNANILLPPRGDWSITTETKAWGRTWQSKSANGMTSPLEKGQVSALLSAIGFLADGRQGE